MTAPSLGGYDLGNVTRETFTKSMPIITLNSPKGDTRDNVALSLIGATRRINVEGMIKFNTEIAMIMWLRGIDGMITPLKLTSVQYESKYYTEPYAGQRYFRVFVADFEHTKEAGEELYVVHYRLDLVEAMGGGDS